MLMHDVKVLLLDEPTFGQDARTAAECMDMIQRIKAEGTAVLMITHDMELVSSYADSVLVLHDTGLAFDGSPAQLFSQETRLVKNAKLTLPFYMNGWHIKRRCVMMRRYISLIRQ